MFGWFTKKTVPPDPATQLFGKIHFDQCVTLCIKTWRECKVSWRELNPETMTPEELAHDIELFGATATHFLFTRFPQLKQAPPYLIWLIVFTAVLEAHTHPADDINKAIDLLRAKYAD